MLRSIPPILSPELLFTLRAMGHGDEIALVDANFPATSMGQRCLRLDGLSCTDVLRAVISLLPLDTFVTANAHVMQVVGAATETPEIVTDFQNILDDIGDNPKPIEAIERFAFYDRAKSCFAIVQTGENRLYGNIILTKGVIGTAPSATTG